MLDSTLLGYAIGLSRLDRDSDGSLSLCVWTRMGVGPSRGVLSHVVGSKTRIGIGYRISGMGMPGWDIEDGYAGMVIHEKGGLHGMGLWDFGYRIGWGSAFAGVSGLGLGRPRCILLIF